MKNKWIVYVNMIGMGLAVYGGLMLLLSGYRSAATMAYALTTLLGIACLIVSFYKQCAILGAIDAKKLPHAYIFWAMMLVCVYFAIGNFVNGINDPSALYRGFIGMFLIFAAGFIFQKKVVPINLKAARIENVLKRETVYTNKENRRYTLMITNVIQDGQMLVEGIVHGEIKVGDLAVLLFSDGNTKRVRIASISKNGITAVNAKDESVQLALDGLKNVNPDDPDSAVVDDVDGCVTLENISIDENGCITGTNKDTGDPVVVGYLALGTVANPNGLLHTDGPYYNAAEAAGDARVFAPNSAVTGGLKNNQIFVNGTQDVDPNSVLAANSEVGLMPGFLEASGTDLATEFSNMIVYQRGYQANTRIIDAAVKRIAVPKEKFYVNIDRFANTSSASIPIALDEMKRDGLIKRGDRLVFAAFGAGLVYGGITVEWTK